MTIASWTHLFKAGSTIRQLNHDPLADYLENQMCYPLDRDLSSGYIALSGPFEQLGPIVPVNNFTVICLGEETCVIMAVLLMVIFFYTQCFF